jgi:O-antigen/teichoic acid export membrane protein
MSSSAARGTLALVFTQGLYFILGYLAVVLLAREMGPVAYGAYGVIMSVLVWLEQSARRVVPAAAAKLIAEQPAALGEIAQSSVLLNLVLHAGLFVTLWLTAPWLEVWFRIEDGTYLFRLAALDLPLYGIYTTLQGVYQGQRRFYRLGLSDLTYALAKLLGIILIAWLGVSIEAALIVNIVASVIGIAFLFTRMAFARAVSLRVHAPTILAVAAPLVVYSIASELALDIWILKAITPPTEAATIGIYVAALNIARVPGFALSTIGRVLLPSVAGAVAINDSTLVRHYMNQAIRFFLILYLPICFVLFASPEALMRFVYSSSYASGDDLLVVLVIAHGLWAIQEILASALIAAGQVRILGIARAVTVALAVPVLAALIYTAGGLGAAVGSSLAALANVAAFGLLLQRQFQGIVRLRNMGRIVAAAGFMPLVSALCATLGGGVVLSSAVGLVAYAGALILLSEVSAQDLTTLRARTSAQGSPASE